MDWLEWSVWLECDAACGPEVSSCLVVSVAYYYKLTAGYAGNLLHPNLAVGVRV